MVFTVKTYFSKEMKKEVQFDSKIFEKIYFESIDKMSQITSLHHLQIPHGLAIIGV
jgi:ribosomal protein L31E